MSWHRHTADLARTLRTLITTPASLPPADVGPFLTARTAIWALVNNVHREINADADRGPDAADLVDAHARDLVVELNGRRLSTLSEPPPELHLTTPTETGKAGVGPVGQVWAGAARSARLARAAWETADPDQRPAGAATLPLLADITSLGWAVSRGTTNAAPDWAAATRPAGRGAAEEHAERVTTVTATALNVLGRARGVADNYADIHPVATQPGEVSGPAQLADGIRQEAELLRRAGHLSPAMAAHIAIQHSWTTRRLGEALVKAGDRLDHAPVAACGRRLLRHAHHLDVDMPGATQVTTINPIEQTSWHAYQQARHVYEAAAGLPSATADKETAAHLLRAAYHVPAVTTAVANTVGYHVATRSWLIRTPATGADEPAPWTATDQTAQLPLQTKLWQARTDADHLAGVLPPAPTRPPTSSVLRDLARTRPAVVPVGPPSWTPRR